MLLYSAFHTATQGGGNYTIPFLLVTWHRRGAGTKKQWKERIRENWLKRWHNSALLKVVVESLSEDRHQQTVEEICLTLVRPADGP